MTGSATVLRPETAQAAAAGDATELLRLGRRMPLPALIVAAERELGLRQQVYPGRVAAGRMTEAQMLHEVRCMAGILTRLLFAQAAPEILSAGWDAKPGDPPAGERRPADWLIALHGDGKRYRYVIQGEETDG